MKVRLIFVLIVSSLALVAQEIPENKLYFGEIPPNDSARILAPGFISVPDRWEPCITFSRDLMSAYFYIEFWPNEGDNYIMSTNYKNGKWTEPKKVSFAEGRKTGEPSFFPFSNTRLYLCSNKSVNQQGIVDLCYVEKNGDSWGDLISLGNPPNRDNLQFHPCVIADSSIYFAANKTGDICKATYKDGRYLTPERLPFPINGANTEKTWGDPFVEQNERYIIFKSTRKGGYGKNDIYITYKREDGKWTNPKNLGPKINTQYDETSGDITPDGKYMTFGSNQDLYWVSTSFIRELKETNFAPYVNDSIRNLIVPINKRFTFEIPANAFIDDDGNETLRYSLQMKDGGSIPEWLAFNIETLEISGKPTKAGEYSLIIKVVDDDQATVFCSFMIEVQGN